MAFDAARKSEIVKEYQTAEGDTGSPEVQVALLSGHIDHLSGHFKEHKHDNHFAPRAAQNGSSTS